MKNRYDDVKLKYLLTEFLLQNEGTNTLTHSKFKNMLEINPGYISSKTFSKHTATMQNIIYASLRKQFLNPIYLTSQEDNMYNSTTLSTQIFYQRFLKFVCRYDTKNHIVIPIDESIEKDFNIRKREFPPILFPLFIGLIYSIRPNGEPKKPWKYFKQDVEEHLEYFFSDEIKDKISFPISDKKVLKAVYNYWLDTYFPESLYDLATQFDKELNARTSSNNIEFHLIFNFTEIKSSLFNFLSKVLFITRYHQEDFYKTLSVYLNEYINYLDGKNTVYKDITFNNRMGDLYENIALKENKYYNEQLQEFKECKTLSQFLAKYYRSYH